MVLLFDCVAGEAYMQNAVKRARPTQPASLRANTRTFASAAGPQGTVGNAARACTKMMIVVHHRMRVQDTMMAHIFTNTTNAISLSRRLPATATRTVSHSRPLRSSSPVGGGGKGRTLPPPLCTDAASCCLHAVFTPSCCASVPAEGDGLFSAPALLLVWVPCAPRCMPSRP